MTLSTINAGVYNAIESGIDIRWAAPLYEANPDAAEGLYVQAELFPTDQDTFDVTALEGKVVSTPAGLGGTSTFILAEQLLEAGLTLDDLTYRQMGTTDILAALEQGGLDMGWLSTPFWGQVADNPGLRYVQGFPDAQNGTAMLMGPSMSERPEVAEAFFRALLGVSEDHLAGDYLGDPEVVAALSSALDTPEEDLIVDAPNVFDAGMRMDGAADFNERMQQTFIDIGGLLDYDEPLPDDAVIDESFLDAARACG
jgi:NitT/TauT family transport system substrate-binding protein